MPPPLPDGTLADSPLLLAQDWQPVPPLQPGVRVEVTPKWLHHPEAYNGWMEHTLRHGAYLPPVLCGSESSSSTDGELPCASLLLLHISPPVSSPSSPPRDGYGTPPPEGVLELAQQEAE